MKKLLLVILLVVSPMIWAGVSPQESAIDPFRFEHAGVEYVIGVWFFSPLGANYAAFARYEEEWSEWRTIGGAMLRLDSMSPEDFEERMNASFRYWNKYFEQPNSEEIFSEWLHGHLIFDGQLRLE